MPPAQTIPHGLGVRTISTVPLVTVHLIGVVFKAGVSVSKSSEKTTAAPAGDAAAMAARAAAPAKGFTYRAKFYAPSSHAFLTANDPTCGRMAMGAPDHKRGRGLEGRSLASDPVLHDTYTDRQQHHLIVAAKELIAARAWRAAGGLCAVPAAAPDQRQIAAAGRLPGTISRGCG